MMMMSAMRPKYRFLGYLQVEKFSGDAGDDKKTDVTRIQPPNLLFYSSSGQDKTVYFLKVSCT